MEAIENAAFVSVGRACGFAGLAILCIMTGLSFAPVKAAQAGGVLCLMVTLFLMFRAATARNWPYRRTETWLILGEDKRPPEKIAQRVIGETLRETFFWFAKQTALFSIGFLAASAVMQIAGIGVWGVWDAQPPPE